MPLALFPADRQLPNFAAGFGVLCRLHGLLPARDLARAIASTGARIEPTCCFGQICRHPNARCSLSDDRRPHPDFKPLHPSRTRSQTPARTTPPHVAGPTATAHQLSWKAYESELKHRSCGTDLLTSMYFWSAFPRSRPLELRKMG